MSDRKRNYSFLTPFLLGAALHLVGCADYGIDRLEKAPREGYEFSQALANQYEAFAKMENSNFASGNADHFAIKGLQAAAGEEVLPEDPREWDVPDKQFDMLMELRHRLMYDLQKGGKRLAPLQAAKAQVAYDCIVSTIGDCTTCGEKEWSMCHETFEKNLKEVERILQKDSPVFTVHFAKDRWELTPQAHELLKEIAKVAANLDKSDVEISGYTDPEGGRKHNLVLSQKRAHVVKEELERLGVPGRRLQALGLGEVPGPEVNPKNRKVMIQIH